MSAFLIRRTINGVLVIACVVVVVFFVTRVVGDPVAAMLPLDSTEEQKAAFAHRLGFDRSIWVQFLDFAKGVAQFDLGESLWQKRPVTEIVFERLPMTLYLVLASSLLALVLALGLGIVAALRPNGIVDRIVVVLSLFGLSLPEFWLGLLLIIIFAVNLGLVPTSGSGTLAHFVLPVVTQAIPTMARMVMIIRSSAMDEFEAQYIRVAKAKGLPFRRVVGVHALRNMLVPVSTLAGWEFIRALAGYTLVVETVFAWPGLGLAAQQAIMRQDLFLLQGIAFYVAVTVVVVNILLDLLRKYVDPRVKVS